MRIAIIGAKGQLGSDIVDVLSKGDINDIFALSHEEIDITKKEKVSILRRIRPDVIINTAAYVKVDEAEDHPHKAFMVNSLGALNIARIANEVGAINVYISTDYVFDGKKRKPYTEEDYPNPLNMYGISKYMGEIFTKQYSSKYYIIRVASLYGKRGSMAKGGNFVEFMINKAKKGEEIKVVEDQFMSPTYTKDVARMLKKLLEISPKYGIYHMVNEGYCSWYEFAKEIFNILNKNVKIIPIKSSELKRKAKRPLFSALDNANLHKLGLKMPHWKDSLKEYMREKKYIS